MRTAEITLEGVTYPMCFNASVMMDIEADGKTTSQVLEQSGESVTTKMWLLHRLMEEGNKLQTLKGEEPPKVPTEAELALTVGFEEFKAVNTAIMETVVRGTKAKVEVKPGKKGTAATQGE